MRDGMIAQSGKYMELLKPGTQLETLVTAHNESMQLVESKTMNLAEGAVYEVCDETCKNEYNFHALLKNISFGSNDFQCASSNKRALIWCSLMPAWNGSLL